MPNINLQHKFTFGVTLRVETQVCFPTLPQASCVTLDKSLNRGVQLLETLGFVDPCENKMTTQCLLCSSGDHLLRRPRL